MPDWKVHLIFGLLFLSFWLSLNQIFSFSTLSFKKVFMFSLLALFISIFPDIDMKKSKSRKIFALFISTLVALIYFVLFPMTWYYTIAYFFLSYFFIILLPTKHRGITHKLTFSLIFSALATSLLYLVFNSTLEDLVFSFFFIFSIYLSHLLLDRL
ncbi:MAG: metal-dependent hydrolase [Candidatus Aenigmatarchaeota archaeon]